MSLIELNLKKLRDRKSINFADRNAVDEFLQTEGFRPCANLECSPVHLEHEVFYMPLCFEGRFKKEGVAEYFDMPLPPRPVSPVTYTTVGLWGPLVSCPSNCKGYRNRTIARIRMAVSRGASWVFEHILKPGEFLWAAFWARLLK